MKPILRQLLTAIILLIGCRSFAQVMPVQVTPQLLPPYSLQVSEYYSGVQPKLQVLLLNRDINRPTIQVKLRMTVESQNCKMRTKTDAVTPTFTLTSGIPYYLTPQDLQAFFAPANIDFSGGYNEQEYVQTGRLPEGLYSFYFEAFELYSANLVSNKGFTLGWLTLADPPLLNTPAKAEGVTPGNPQNIIFNWTPRHNTSPTAGYFTDYVFTITEYNDVTLGPDASFTSSPPLFIDSVQTTTYLFGPGQPQLVPGKRYAWRVQAKAKNGAQQLAMFRNNGFSEVYWFTYEMNCPAPLGINASIQGQRVVIQWQNNPQHLDYKVEYREKNQADAQWFPLQNTLPRVVLNDLKPATQYEYRVGGSCQQDQFTFSGLYTFTTNAANVNNVVNCGDSTLPSPGSGQTLQVLNAGDTIQAGSFTVYAGYTTGTGSFTGMGYVIVPWLLNAKVEVKFTNITLSLDHKLLSGEITTTYDPTESGIEDIDEYIDIFTPGYGVGGVVTGEVTADTTFTFTIQWPGGISAQLPPGYDPQTGIGQGPVTISVTPQGGGVPVTYTVPQLPTTLMDATGNIYQVNKQGQVVPVGTKGGGTTMLGKANKKQVDVDKAVVKFVPYNDAKVQFAFDEWKEVYKKSSAFSKEYERLGGDYYVPAKAIAPGETDYLKAVVTIVDNTIKPDSIQFVNGKGTIYKKTRIEMDSVGYRFEVAVVGGPEKDAQEIYALYPQSDGKTLNLGKVLVASYPNKEFKVKLVPVNGTSVNADSVKNKLKAIYGKVNIGFTVTVDSNFSKPGWDLNNDGLLDVASSSAFTKYSSEMFALKELYRSSRATSADTRYLFIVPQCNDAGSIAGEMVRGKQYGYLFGNRITAQNTGPVTAHELGHGLFSLKHPFDGYGFDPADLPDNLMNYNNGGFLAKLQWDFLHDPAIALNLFDDEKDNQYVIAEGALQDILSEFANKGAYNNTFTFLTPAGKPITLPGTAKSVRFSTRDRIVDVRNVSTGEYSPIGALTGFTLNNTVYVAKYNDKNFLHYGVLNATAVFDETVTANLKPAKAIIALPWFTDKLYFTVFQVDITPGNTAANYVKDSYNRYVGHGVALVNNFSIIDYVKNNIDPTAYTGYSDEFVTLMAQSWSLASPHKRLETAKTNLQFSKSGFDYLEAQKAFTGEGSVLSPLIISNAWYLSGLSYAVPNITCLATTRMELFHQKLKELELTFDIKSFNKTKLGFLNDYYKELQADLAAYNLQQGTEDSRDINELIEKAITTETSLLKDLFSMLENQCLYANISSKNRLLLLRKLFVYAEQLTHEAGPPFPFNLWSESPESICKNVMTIIKGLIENARFSNQQMAIINDLFVVNGKTYLPKLYYLGRLPYAWLRTDVMTVFSFISQTMSANFTPAAQTFSLDKTGDVSFNAGFDAEFQKVHFSRNGAETVYNLLDLVTVSVPASTSFLVFDPNQTGTKAYKIPAIFLCYMIQLQNIDAAWQNEAARFRIFNDIVMMIAAIPTDGASLEAEAILWYWISGADIMLTLQKSKLQETELGRNVLETWDKLIAVIAVYQMGEYIVIENSNVLRLKLNQLRNVIKTKFNDWLKIETRLRDVLRSTSRLNISYHSAALLTKTEFQIEALVLDANFTASQTSTIGLNTANKIFIEYNGIQHELATMEGTGIWHITEVKSKTVLQTDIKLGSVTNGRFYKPTGVIAEHEYDIYYRSNNEVFIARNGDHVHWPEMRVAYDVPGAMRHIKIKDLPKNGKDRDIKGCHDDSKFFDQSIVRSVDLTGLAPAAQAAYNLVPVNMLPADVAEAYILSVIPHPIIPHVKIVQYKIPGLNAASKTNGQLNATVYQKTVYEAAFWDDVKLEQALKEVVVDVVNNYGNLQNGKSYKGLTKEGYQIEFWFRDNKIETWYFK
jgi:hypothetical protein